MTVFDRMREKYGSHEKAARNLGISAKTYFNWKRTLMDGKVLSPQAVALIEKHLFDRGLDGKERKKENTADNLCKHEEQQE